MKNIKQKDFNFKERKQILNGSGDENRYLQWLQVSKKWEAALGHKTHNTNKVITKVWVGVPNITSNTFLYYASDVRSKIFCNS